jgi:hypothetical protein
MVRQLGQARVVQSVALSQARQMRLPSAFSLGLAHAVQGVGAWGAECVHTRKLGLPPPIRMRHSPLLTAAAEAGKL